MSAPQWISPIQVTKLAILNIAFDTKDSYKSKEIDFNLALNIGKGTPVINESEYRCNYILEVVPFWFDPKTKDEAFSARCKIGIEVSSPIEILKDFDEEHRDRFIAANAVSLAYGKIRAILESITAESPVGRQSIPTVNPYEVVESMEQADKSNNDL